VLRVETSLSEIMCGLVSSGFGVAVSDPFTAAEFAQRGVVSRPFLPRIDFEFAAVFPPQRSPSPVAQEFVELFAAHVRAMAQRLGLDPRRRAD
jgi:DNA-binding transcriptional LysR family regulator